MGVVGYEKYAAKKNYGYEYGYDIIWRKNQGTSRKLETEEHSSVLNQQHFGNFDTWKKYERHFHFICYLIKTKKCAYRSIKKNSGVRWGMGENVPCWLDCCVCSVRTHLQASHTKWPRMTTYQPWNHCSPSPSKPENGRIAIRKKKR